MSCGKRWRNLNPYDLHKTLINEYLLTAKGTSSLLKRDRSKDKTDIDIIRENHQFLWNDNELDTCQSWEKKLAKKYYEKLFKEYCIADLSMYKENKIGMRWRTENEVYDGKGQFTCGSKSCTEKDSLRSWEVNFGYIEQKVKKNALVKLRLCPKCSKKLNYHHQRKEVKRLQQATSQSVKSVKSLSHAKNDDVGMQTEKSINESKEDSAVYSNVCEIWKQSTSTEEIVKEEARAREEEFDDYLKQLFM